MEALARIPASSSSAGRIVDWGSQAAGALAAAPAPAGAQRTTRLRPLSEARQVLEPIDEATVRTAGWELREPMLLRNDGLCVERQAFGSLSLAEKHAGSLPAGVAALRRSEGPVPAAMVVAYGVDLGGVRTNLHAAPLAQARDGQLLVIDHIATAAEDGVMPLQQWMGRIRAPEQRAYIVPALAAPPMSDRPAAGIPPFVRAADPAWVEGAAERLANSVDRAERQRIPPGDLS